MIKTVLSTIITAPSTMIPKSMAPRLIRLAQTSKMFIRIKANKSDNGIVEATINPPRQFPSRMMSTKMTMSPPSSKLLVTVEVVSDISSLRSRNGFIDTPSGRDFSIWVILSFTFSTTSLEFAPFSIITIPPTVSPSPFLVSAP